MRDVPKDERKAEAKRLVQSISVCIGGAAFIECVVVAVLAMQPTGGNSNGIEVLGFSPWSMPLPTFGLLGALNIMAVILTMVALRDVESAMELGLRTKALERKKLLAGLVLACVGVSMYYLWIEFRDFRIEGNADAMIRRSLRLP